MEPDVAEQPEESEQPSWDDVSDSPDPEKEAEEAEKVEESEEPQEEPDVAEIDIGKDDFGGDDLFSDIEDSEESESTQDDPLADLEEEAGPIADAVNSGAARAAVAGLEDADELQEEFEDIFDAFRLGHFSEQVADEYVFIDGKDDIDPAWGLLGSLLCCIAVVMWMRPDGDEQIERLQDAISGIASGS